jgi:glycosyltransferase involved in cell wall biosynthesis
LNILLLNQAFYPDVVATAQYASDLASQLVERGHRVTVIASRRGYADPKVHFPWSEMWRGVRILRCPASGFGKASRWRRAFDFATFFLTCGVRASVLSRFDAVVALTSPPMVSALGAVVARMNGARFIYWVMDLNPDEAIAAGWLKPGSKISGLLKGILNFSLRRSDHVVVLDRFMATRLAQKGVPAGKLQVIPLWPQDDVVSHDREAADEFRRAHDLQNKFVVMYSGNHSPCHPLDTLLTAARQLRENTQVAFCFVGGGSEFSRVSEFARKHELQNVRCISYQPFDKLSASLSAADLHTVIMGDPFVGIVHPSKVYNIRSIGTPFLYIGPTSSPVAELTPAISFRHGDAEGVAEFIRQAASDGMPRFQSGSAPFTRHRLLDQLISTIGGQPQTTIADVARG